MGVFQKVNFSARHDQIFQTTISEFTSKDGTMNLAIEPLVVSQSVESVHSVNSTGQHPSDEVPSLP